MMLNMITLLNLVGKFLFIKFANLEYKCIEFEIIFNKRKYRKLLKCIVLSIYNQTYYI